MSKHERQIARDISYANSAKGRSGRALIRVMENATGRLDLIRRAKGYADDVANGADFWEVMAERYGLSLDIVGGSLDSIPKDGPLITVANHPYGILDGLMMGLMLSQRRDGEFKVLAHRVFRNAPDLEKVILPISFDETKEAAKQNLATRAEALNYLKGGGAIGVFPGGTVSTSAKAFSKPLDPTWRNFTGKMVARSNATVVPIFFDGSNSRLFQIGSHLHYTLRMGLMVREFKARINSPVRVVIGEPIPVEDLANVKGDPTQCMDFLRKATYDLSPRPMNANEYGHEFEAKYKGRAKNGSRNI